MREDILVTAIAGVDVGPAKKLAPPSGRRQLEYRTGHRPQRKPFDYRPPQRAVSLPLKS
jgi:hypothetical protein